MITRPKTSETPTAPSDAGVDRVGDDRPAAGEDEGEGAEGLGGGAAAEVGAAVHRVQQQAAGVAAGSRNRDPSRGREDLAHRVERAWDEAEVAVGAAPLARDHAGLDQLLEVVADRALREAEQRLHLADADRLAAGSQQQVDDPQPVPVGERLQHRLQLDRPLVGERGPGQRRAALDHGKLGHERERLRPFIEDHR